MNTICQLQMLTKGQLSHQYKYHSLIKKKKKKAIANVINLLFIVKFVC